MTIFIYVLYTLLGVYLLNYIMLAVLSRLERYRAKRRQKISNITYGGGGHVKKPKHNRIVRFIYSLLNGWMRFSLIHLGRIPCHTYRDFILRHVYMMDMKENVIIYGGFEIRSPWNIHIGRGSIIGDNSILDGRNGLIIGENVNFSTGVNIWTEQHDMNDPMFECNDKGGEVRIDDRAWVSTRTIILPGVHIHEGAVVAAGAVVTKDCEEYTVYGGVPAKKIGTRNRDLQYNFDGRYLPFY